MPRLWLLTCAFAGAAVGIAIGAVLILATEGVGVLLLVPLASSGAEIGKQLAKKLLPKMTSGSIKEGAATVVCGTDRKPAARILDPIDCMDPLGMTALITPSIPAEHPELTPAMQRRREVLLKRRPPRQWSDTFEDGARWNSNRGH